jgi:hypothetical protein
MLVTAKGMLHVSAQYFNKPSPGTSNIYIHAGKIKMVKFKILVEEGTEISPLQTYILILKLFIFLG